MANADFTDNLKLPKNIPAQHKSLLNSVEPSTRIILKHNSCVLSKMVPFPP